jgi:hypothetical protein
MSGFDAPYWNALQVLAWVYLGDRALVDLCGGGTSSAGTYRAEHKVLGEDGGLHSVVVETPGNPPNVRRLAVYAAAWGRASTGSPGTEDDEREILRKLVEGCLSVTGKQRDSRVRQEIAALEWCDLNIDYDKQAAVDRVSGKEIYGRLMFRREAVLKLWPDVLAVDEKQPIDSGNAEPAAPPTKKKPGPKPKLLNECKEKMLTDLRQGRRTVKELSADTLPALDALYGGSDNTAKKAREAAISAFPLRN